MLAIRLQRLGRKAYPVYRLAVQEAQRHPSSGRVVAYVGSYNPHTKDLTLDREAILKYIGNGAQPSNSVIKLLQQEKVALPDWVVLKKKNKKSKQEPVEEPAAAPAEEAPAEEAPAEEPAAEAEEAAE